MGTDTVDGLGLANGDLGMPTISIIIPTLNEAKTLPYTLRAIGTAANVEVVVADGGSTDDTCALALAGQATVVITQAGRANQMNGGAKIARGDILLFLHADTDLPPDFDDWIRCTLSQPGVVAGAFELAINGSAWGLRWVEWGVGLRSRWLQMPYGDQALFMRATVFWDLGGFPALPLMEDFELVRRLRQRGQVAIAPVSVLTSGRRWQKLGIVRTTLINQGIILAYLLGVDPARLARWYRQWGRHRRDL